MDNVKLNRCFLRFWELRMELNAKKVQPKHTN